MGRQNINIILFVFITFAATIENTKQVGPLSYSRTIYDIGGKVQMTVTLDEAGYEQPTSYKYDKSGKQIEIIDPLGHDITHSQQGNWYVISTCALKADGSHRCHWAPKTSHQWAH